MIVQPSNIQQPAPSEDAPLQRVSWYLPYLPNVAAKTAEPQFYMTSYPLEFALISEANAETAAGTYYEFQVLGRNLHAVQVECTNGTYSATVLLEGTLDGNTWSTVESITSTGIVQLTGLYQSLRVSIPSYTSGTINVSAISMRS